MWILSGYCCSSRSRHVALRRSVLFADRLLIGLLARWIHLRICVLQRCHRKESTRVMSTHTVPIEEHLTPSNPYSSDQIGNEVYASHYAERKLSRFIIGTETVLLLGAFGLIFSLSNRPIANRYIRIDEMGQCSGHPVHRPELQPARGRNPHLPHRLGELSLHNQPGHGRQKVSVELLLSLADARHQTDDRGQSNPPRLAGDCRADRAVRCRSEERHDYVHVQRDGTGSSNCPRNGSCHHRPAVFAEQFP